VLPHQRNRRSIVDRRMLARTGKDLTMRRSISILLALLLGGLIAAPTLAVPIHALGDQDPIAAGFTRGANFAGWTRGWRFSVATAGVSVSELGMFAGSSGDFVISLFDVASGLVLAQQSVTHTRGAWQWTGLASSVALTQGAEYTVALSPAAKKKRYYFGSLATVGSSWFPNGDLQYLDTRYCNGCAPGTMPGLSLSDTQYGLVDVGYSVPEASALLMLTLGLAGLAWQAMITSRR